MSDPEVLVVLDQSGSTADSRPAIERSVAELADALIGFRLRFHAWTESISEIDSERPSADDWPAQASFDALETLLTNSADTIVVYTDACLYNESEAISLRGAAAQVAGRAARGIETYVVLLGDSPDEANGALLHSWRGLPWRLEQTLELAATIEAGRHG